MERGERLELTNPVTAHSADSPRSEGGPEPGLHQSGAFNRRRVAESSLLADAQGRRAWSRWRHRTAVRAAPGGESARSTSAVAGKGIPGPAGQAGLHRKGRRQGTRAGGAGVRGQGRPTGGRDAVGGDLRAGLPSLFVWISTGEERASSATPPAGRGDARVAELDRGRRHPRFFSTNSIRACYETSCIGGSRMEASTG